MKFWLMGKHLIDRLLLWQATIELDNASRLVIEANDELDRAVALSVHLLRKRDDARMRAQNSGWRIDRAERIKFLGI